MSSSDHCGIGTVKTFLDDMLNHTGCVRRVGAGFQNDCVSSSQSIDQRFHAQYKKDSSRDS